MELGRSGRDALDLPDGAAAGILRLAAPIAVAPGDRFVLRRSSGAERIVGAVLDVTPPRGISRRRQTAERVGRLAAPGGRRRLRPSPTLGSTSTGSLPGPDGRVLVALDIATSVDAVILAAVAAAGDGLTLPACSRRRPGISAPADDRRRARVRPPMTSSTGLSPKAGSCATAPSFARPGAPQRPARSPSLMTRWTASRPPRRRRSTAIGEAARSESARRRGSAR